MEDCIFCKIIKGELPSSKIYEDNDFIVFLDIFPVSEGHVLVVPKKHCQLVADLDDEVLSKMMVLAGKIIKAMKISNIKIEALNLFIADGKQAGQEVPHVHLHLIPRFENDKVGEIFAGKVEKDYSKEELDSIAENIKLNLK